MLALLLAVLLIQLLTYLIVFSRGILNRRRTMPSISLSERTANRKVYLETTWSAAGPTWPRGESEVLDRCPPCWSGTVGIEALMTDQALCQEVVASTADDIVPCSAANGVTGAFLVLDCPGENEARPGVYIRGLGPASFSADNKDLLMERGLPGDGPYSGHHHGTATERSCTASASEDAAFPRTGGRGEERANLGPQEPVLRPLERAVFPERIGPAGGGLLHSADLGGRHGIRRAGRGPDGGLSGRAAQVRRAGEERSGAYFLASAGTAGDLRDGLHQRSQFPGPISARRTPWPGGRPAREHCDPGQRQPYTDSTIYGAVQRLKPLTPTRPSRARCGR